MRPKRSLSQNFLTNDRAARRIVESLNLKKDDTVLEIGAGKGALTRHLLDKAKKVYAVEVDKRLCSFLQQRFGDKENLKTINKDILKTNFRDLIGPDNFCKVVGNLPYQITSPIFSLLLENKEFIALCVLMVQKEVALRICAVPGNKDWSPLSIAVQFYSDVKILFHLKPASFFPPPQVESSVIKIVFLSEPKVYVPDEKLFFNVVRSAFGQRRKMLLNSLAANLDLPKKEIEVILNKVDIDPQRRAETLSLNEFAKLSSAMCEILN
ncbi:MAG: ribosomal RNA small subunit methyltransferase A [candidate division Zixibacteria bacterium]|nr:ribosomal RNA small subunit methyltransferase A [candidate division Zixibacteria bacterium]